MKPSMTFMPNTQNPEAFHCLSHDAMAVRFMHGIKDLEYICTQVMDEEKEAGLQNMPWEVQMVFLLSRRCDVVTSVHPN